MANLDVEKLINEIHPRPAIWNMRSEDYSNKIKKKRSWEKVTEAFADENATQEQKKEIGSLLQKKWKNIRDRYARELKENKGKSGQARKNKNAYMYANQLAFFSDVIHRRPTDASIDNMYPSSPDHESDIVSETPTILGEPSDVNVAKKRKGNLVERKLLEAIENHTIRQKEKSQTEKVISCEDDDKLFLLSLLPFVKSIPPHFKFAARMDIMQTINRFMIIRPPAPNQQQLYSQNRNQPPNYQSVTQQCQYLNLQPVSTGVQPYFSQSPSVHEQEPQPGPSGIQQQNDASPLISSISSLYFQDDAELSLF